MYTHLFESAFLISFTDPSKQLPNVKSVFYLYLLGIYLVCKKYIYLLLLLLLILLFIKQCPLNFTSGNI